MEPNPPAFVPEAFEIVSKPPAVVEREHWGDFSREEPDKLAVEKARGRKEQLEVEKEKEDGKEGEESDDELSDLSSVSLWMPKKLLALLALVFILVASERFVAGLDTENPTTNVVTQPVPDLALMEITSVGVEALDVVESDPAKAIAVVRDQSTQTMSIREEVRLLSRSKATT